MPNSKEQNVLLEAREMISEMEKIRDKFEESLSVEELLKIQQKKLNTVREILIHVRKETRIELANKDVQILELQKQLRGYMMQNAKLETDIIKLDALNKELSEELNFANFDV